MIGRLSPGSFGETINDARAPACLYGTVPPPLRLDEEKRVGAARAVAEACIDLQPDALVVYDVQDEPGRDGTERPFPFSPSHDPLLYSTSVKEAYATAVANDNGGAAPVLNTIVYHAACERPRAGFQAWLKEARGAPHHVNNVVLVGKSSSSAAHPGFESLADAYEALHEQQAGDAAAHPAPMTVGAVCLPERHLSKGAEGARMAAKAAGGCSFFVTQVVYDPDAAITVIRDYDRACRDAGVTPRRIFFTFAPCSRASVMRFMRWLGVSVPEGTAARILTAESPVKESLAVCRENWDRILRAHRAAGYAVPLGFLTESLSRFKSDSDGARSLFKECRQLLIEHCAALSQ